MCPGLDNEVFYTTLNHRQVRRRGNRGLHGLAIELTIGLGAGALNSRTLGAIEQPTPAPG